MISVITKLYRFFFPKSKYEQQYEKCDVGLIKYKIYFEDNIEVIYKVPGHWMWYRGYLSDGKGYFIKTSPEERMNRHLESDFFNAGEDEKYPRHRIKKVEILSIESFIKNVETDIIKVYER